MGTHRDLSQITTVVIHCADTPNGRANTIEDIDAWHGERGFKRALWLAKQWQPHLKHVGYHFVIEVDGAVRPGRQLHETGAHVEGHNHNSIGICMVGRDKFSFEQWESLRTLVQLLLHPANDLGVKLTAICGHRDLNPGKTCPGFDVADWLLHGYQPTPDQILMPAEGHQ